MLTVRGSSGARYLAFDDGFNKRVVLRHEPRFAPNVVRVESIITHPVTARVSVASRQRCQRHLPRRALTHPARTDRRHTFHAPDQTVRIPFRYRRIRRPAESVGALRPDDHVATVRVRKKICPHEMLQRIRREPFKRQIRVRICVRMNPLRNPVARIGWIGQHPLRVIPGGLLAGLV